MRLWSKGRRTFGDRVPWQAAEPGLKRVDGFDAAGKAFAAELLGDRAGIFEELVPVLAHQHENGGVIAERHQIGAGVRHRSFGLSRHQGCVLVHGTALGAEDLREEASGPLFPFAPVAAQQAHGLEAVEKEKARGETKRDRQAFEACEDVRIGFRRKAFDRDRGDELVAVFRRIAAPELLAAKQRIEIHGARRHVDGRKLAREDELEIVQEIVPQMLAARRVDDAKALHAPKLQDVGEPVFDFDERALERFDLPVAGTFLLSLRIVVINDFGEARGAPKRRHVAHKQRILGFEMSAFGEELAPALFVDGARHRVRKKRGRRLGIAGRGQTHRVDPQREACAKLRERGVDALGEVVEFGRRRALAVGATVEEACEKRAVLAKDHAFVDEGSRN